MKKKPAHLWPIQITETAWMYAERGALLFVCEARTSDGVHIRTEQVKVPWAKIKRALAIRPKPRKRS